MSLLRFLYTSGRNAGSIDWQFGNSHFHYGCYPDRGWILSTVFADSNWQENDINTFVTNQINLICNFRMLGNLLTERMQTFSIVTCMIWWKIWFTNIMRQREWEKLFSRNRIMAGRHERNKCNRLHCCRYGDMLDCPLVADDCSSLACSRRVSHRLVPVSLDPLINLLCREWKVKLAAWRCYQWLKWRSRQKSAKEQRSWCEHQWLFMFWQPHHRHHQLWSHARAGRLKAAGAALKSVWVVASTLPPSSCL